MIEQGHLLTIHREHLEQALRGATPPYRCLASTVRCPSSPTARPTSFEAAEVDLALILEAASVPSCSSTYLHDPTAATAV